MEEAEECELFPVHCGMFLFAGFGFNEDGFFYVAFHEFCYFLARDDAIGRQSGVLQGLDVGFYSEVVAGLSSSCIFTSRTV